MNVVELAGGVHRRSGTEAEHAAGDIGSDQAILRFRPKRGQRDHVCLHAVVGDDGLPVDCSLAWWISQLTSSGICSDSGSDSTRRASANAFLE